MSTDYDVGVEEEFFLPMPLADIIPCKPGGFVRTCKGQVADEATFEGHPESTRLRRSVTVATNVNRTPASMHGSARLLRNTNSHSLRQERVHSRSGASLLSAPVARDP